MRLYRLYNGVYRIDRPCLRNVARIDHGCTPMILEMNNRGITLDQSVLRRLSGDLNTEAAEILSRTRVITGVPDLNPNSDDQVARLLFDVMGLSPPGGGRKTKSGSRISVDSDALLSMTDQAPELIRLILRYRELRKLDGTYCTALPKHVGTDGRVRTRLMMNVARTGRLSSESPNLQNIPARTKDGQRIRSAFVAAPGLVLASIDLSQIEMVWAAELSQDQAMMNVFLGGHDLHAVTACAMFRLDYSYISGQWGKYKRGELIEGSPAWSEMRDFEVNKRLPSKTLGFAVLYGVTPKGLQTQILAAGGPYWSEPDCAEFIRRWFSIYPGVRSWMDSQHARARRWGMVWSAFGRIRRIPEAQSLVPRVCEDGLRRAGNHPIQASAGDHLKLAMAYIYDVLIPVYRHWGVCEPVLQIHDELLFELSPDIAGDFLHDCASALSGAVPLSVPVKSSANIADNWGDLK